MDQPRHPTTFGPALICTALALAAPLGIVAGCGNKAEVQAAKRSLYDTDFARVYSGALAATRELYANIDDNPGSGAISTAWHQVQFAGTTDDLNNATVGRRGGTGTMGGMGTSGMPTGNTGTPTRLSSKRYFVRFDVSVIGGRPWRVKVVGHASEWEPGAAMPVEMHGAARPAWLDGRLESLTVAIYRKVKQYAVPMKEEVAAMPDEGPRFEAAAFKGVPAGAATTLAATKTALAQRDWTLLRKVLADDVTWSLGGAPGADTAMAMWQADAEGFEAMAKAIDAGCTPAVAGAAGGAASGTAGGQVRCPGGEPVPGKFQLVLEPRGPSWRIASFVRGE
jgi:hypothetical protein